MKFSTIIGLLATVSVAAAALATDVDNLSPAERYVAALAQDLGIASLPRSPAQDAPSNAPAERTLLERNDELSKRIVGTVKCTPYKTGTLVARTKDGQSANARFGKPQHGVDGGKHPVLLTAVNGHALKPQRFTFSTCNGTFMGTKPSKGAFNGSPDTSFVYGHLSVASHDDEHCVEPYALGQLNKEQYVVRRACSFSDDSSQMLQWWSLVEVPSSQPGGKSTLYLQFVGSPEANPDFDPSDFKGEYGIVKRTGTVGEGDHAVDATWVGIELLYGQGISNPYSLILA